MRDLRAPVCMAQGLDACLERHPLLLGPLPQEQGQRSPAYGAQGVSAAKKRWASRRTAACSSFGKRRQVA